MNMLWYRRLGFHNNPFSIKPAVFHDGLMGYEDLLDDVSYSVLKNKLLFVEGDFGKGKTTMLKRLLRDFGGKKEVIYFSCNRLDARLDVDRLLRGKFGFWGKLFDMKPQNMVLLLDEVQGLSKRDCDRIHNYHKRGFFRSVVFVGKKYEKKGFTTELNKDIEVFKLGKINEEDAVAIIRRRMGRMSLLPDSMIKKIFNSSDSNPRKLLKNCEAVCRYAMEYGEDVVTDEILKEVLNTPIPKVEIIADAPTESKKFAKEEELESPVMEVDEVIAAAETAKPIAKKVNIKKKAVKKKVVKKKVVKKAVKKVEAPVKPIEVASVEEAPVKEEAPVEEAPAKEEELDDLDRELENVKIEEEEEEQLRARPKEAELDSDFATEDDLEEKELLGEEHYY